MIQFNLLPDIKLEFIKATYKRRIISLISFIVAGAFLTVFILMFLFVRVNQTHHLGALDKDIKTQVSKLQSNQDLDKILTIQNQLNSLPALHDKKVLSSRVFGYLNQVTPAQAKVSNVEIDLEAHSIVIKGTADSIQTLNKYVDTLKFTDFKVEGDSPKEGKAFTSVVLQSFNFENQAATGKTVSYEVSFSYDEAIFSNTAEAGNAVANRVKLTVPNIITTRSETQKPSALFEQSTTPAVNQEGQ